MPRNDYYVYSPKPSRFQRFATKAIFALAALVFLSIALDYLDILVVFR